jgi:hypothetical protein
MSADFMTADAQTGETARSESSTCGAPSCWRDAAHVRVGDREAVLCSVHRKAFLEVSS